MHRSTCGIDAVYAHAQIPGGGDGAGDGGAHGADRWPDDLTAVLQVPFASDMRVVNGATAFPALGTAKVCVCAS